MSRLSKRSAIIFSLLLFFAGIFTAAKIISSNNLSSIPKAAVSNSPNQFSLRKRISQHRKFASKEEALIAVMQTAAGHTLESYVYVDMNHDGFKELIGVYPDSTGLYQTWYCSSDGKTCAAVHQNNVDMDACAIELLDFHDETHVVINAYRMMGAVKNYSILALKNGKEVSDTPVIFCLASNKYGYVYMAEHGDILLDIEAYDGTSDPDYGLRTHTWKDTYLFYDGETYKEYGADQITEAEYLTYENAQFLKEIIDSQLRQSDTEKIVYSYFRRKNNILHIQCNVYSSSGKVQYGYYTVRFSGDVLDRHLGEYNRGIMQPSFSDWEVV